MRPAGLWESDRVSATRLEDRELIDRVRSGDERALEALYRRYGG